MKSISLHNNPLSQRLAVFVFFCLSGLANTSAQNAQPVVNGCYFIQNQNEKVLDVANSSRENGAGFILWDAHGGDNQKFLLLDAGDGSFYFKNVNSGKVVTRVKGPNDVWTIKQADMNGSDEQKFMLEKAVPSAPGYYRLVYKADTGQAIEATEDGMLNLKLSESNVMGGDIIGQHFRFVECPK